MEEFFFFLNPIVLIYCSGCQGGGEWEQVGGGKEEAGGGKGCQQ